MATVSGRPSYRWLTITLLVAAGVYAWYAISQYQRLNDLNQRQLSNAAAELKTALENAVVTVEQFNIKWNDSKGEKPLACDFVASQPYLDLTGCEPGSAKKVAWGEFTKVQAVIDPMLGIKVTGAEADSKWLRYLTDKLLQELAFHDSFALIVVAADNGTVLYQEAPTRRRWLRHLRWGEQRFRDAHADRPPTHQIHNVLQVVGGEAPWQKLRALSSRTTVELGGTDHQLYLQPVVLTGNQPLTLIVGGAVPRAAVIRDALALGTPVLGVLVFLLLFGVVGFPFVKLAWLDFHERFSLWDIKLLYISTGALLVLFTCASLAADGYVRWRQEADGGLAPFAANLERRFVEEVEAIRTQLSSYDEWVKKKTASISNCDTWPVDTNWFREEKTTGLPWPRDVHLKTVAWIEPGGRQIWKSTGDAVPGKIWVGHRVYFRAVREGNLFQVNGEGPPFFIGPDRSIADGKFYTFLSIASGIKPALCADAAASGAPVVVATAQLLSLDRQPLPAGYGFALVNREGRVLYHSDGRLSLRENLFEELSEGGRARALMYSGARDGFHTRYRERAHSFFFYPTRFSRAGRASAIAPPVDSHSASNDSGFYLVVFRDTSLDQALVGHVFVVGLVGPMGLLLMISLLGFGALSWAARRHHQRWSVWLWPHGGLNPVYKRQVAGFLVLLIVSTGAYVRLGTLMPFVLSSLLAPTLGLYIYRRWMPPTGDRSPLSMPMWQRLSVFLVLVCMLVVPSAALFRASLSHEFAKLILTERDWIEAQHDDVLSAARVEALDQRYAAERTEQLREARRTYLGCVPPPFDASEPESTSGVSYARVEPPQHVPAVLRAPSPSSRPAPGSCALDAEVSGRSGAIGALEPTGLSPDFIEILHWMDSLLPIENEILARQHFRADRELAYSPPGTIFPAFKASEIALAGFAATLALLYWWIRWNTNQMFLGDLKSSAVSVSGAPEQLWDDVDDHEQMVLVQIARERIANPHQLEIVKKLLEKGLLRLNPDIQPASKELETFLTSREREEDIVKWQAEVEGRHSWRYGRLVLVSALACVGFFLIATQPGLQSSVVAIATGITGVLTAGSKLREAVSSWFARRSTA